MTGLDAYIKYLALNRHFKKTDYDFFKYNGKVRCSEAAFKKNRCFHFFERLAHKYNDTELIRYLVAPYIYLDKDYIWWQEYVDSGNKLYQRYVSETDDIDSFIESELDSRGGFRKEIFQSVDKSHPQIVRWYISKAISPVTFYSLEHCVGFLKDADIIQRDLKKKAAKIIPFLIGG